MNAIQTHRYCILPYANALPLVHFVQEADPAAKLICRTPRAAVETLPEGKADAALVPVAGYFSRPDLRMIPGLGICARGDVTSVLLQCRRPLSQVRVVRLDSESRTSNVLVQVLIRDHFRLSRRVKYGLHVEQADAWVCIGDRALCADPARETYDLAGEWRKMTGLPFVFAVWAVRRSCPDAPEIARILHRAKERGCRSLGELARLCAERLGLPPDRCREYLAHRLHYDVGPAECAGMSLFRRLAGGLFEPALSPIHEGRPSRKEGHSAPVPEWS
jgi:chorismate dehydratase